MCRCLTTRHAQCRGCRARRQPPRGQQSCRARGDGDHEDLLPAELSTRGGGGVVELSTRGGGGAAELSTRGGGGVAEISTRGGGDHEAKLCHED